MVSQFPNEVAACQRAILKDGDSAYRVARAEPRLAGLGDDPRLVRPLPWAEEMYRRHGEEWIRAIAVFGYGILLAAVVIALPGGLVWRMVRRRRWGLRTMLLLPVVVAIVVTVLTADLPLVPRHIHTVGKAETGLTAVHTPRR